MVRRPCPGLGSPRGGPAPLGPACLRQGPHSRTRNRTRTAARPVSAEQVYWAKHRIELDATLQALAAAKAGALEASKGEPDAGRMERK